MCASWCDLFALPKCVHLPYLRHVSLMTKIYGLLIIICTFTKLCYSIDSYSPIIDFTASYFWFTD